MTTGLIGFIDARRPAVRWRRHLKRALDLLAALLAVVLLAPLMALIWLVVRLDSPGPAIFRQERLGRGARPFRMYKFRSMRLDSDDSVHRTYVTQLLTQDDPQHGGSDGVFKLVDDPRVTRVGALLRRTSLDELPQLVNVLLGHMSLVGPRPALAWEAQMYEQRYWRRFDVPPGVTGLWQVSGRSELTMRQALDLDLDYVRRRSAALDLVILLRTVPSLLRTQAR